MFWVCNQCTKRSRKHQETVSILTTENLLGYLLASPGLLKVLLALGVIQRLLINTLPLLFSGVARNGDGEPLKTIFVQPTLFVVLWTGFKKLWVEKTDFKTILVWIVQWLASKICHTLNLHEKQEFPSNAGHTENVLKHNMFSVLKTHPHYKNLHIIHLKVELPKDILDVWNTRFFFFFLVKGMDHVTSDHFYTYTHQILSTVETTLSVAGTCNANEKKLKFWMGKDFHTVLGLKMSFSS